MISLAAVGILYTFYLLQTRFSLNRLATVVETTNYPVYEIPFPAVTICNNNRVNWLRVHNAMNMYKII